MSHYETIARQRLSLVHSAERRRMPERNRLAEGLMLIVGLWLVVGAVWVLAAMSGGFA